MADQDLKMFEDVYVKHPLAFQQSQKNMDRRIEELVRTEKQWAMHSRCLKANEDIQMEAQRSKGDNNNPVLMNKVGEAAECWGDIFAKREVERFRNCRKQSGPQWDTNCRTPYMELMDAVSGAQERASTKNLPFHVDKIDRECEEYMSKVLGQMPGRPSASDATIHTMSCVIPKYCPTQFKALGACYRQTGSTATPACTPLVQPLVDCFAEFDFQHVKAAFSVESAQ